MPVDLDMLVEREGRRTLLVVDDDPLNADSVTLLLRVQGHTVAVARSGREAFGLLKTGPPSDLIFLDLITPLMNVREFPELQSQDAGLAPIPVVILSGSGAAERRELPGKVGHLQKPIDPDELNGLIRRFTVARRPVVLIVDDEAGVVRMLETVLRHYGFNVRSAGDGGEGIEVYEQHHTDIDVVLLDVQMPDLDGPATLASLRIINPHVRSCFMSGHTGRYSVEELLGCGACYVLQIPFASLPLLAQTLWSLIEKRPPTNC
jgi:CheY-like chemotaxis protein